MAAKVTAYRLYRSLVSLATELQMHVAMAEGITAAEVRGELQPYLLEAEDRNLAIFEPYIELWPQAVKCKQEVERHIRAQLRIDYLSFCQLSDEQLRTAIERLELERPELAEQLSTLIAREYPGVLAELQCRMQAREQSEAPLREIPPENQTLAAVIRAYTSGVSEERIRQIASIAAQKTLSARERLEKINSILPIPLTATSADLADMFGCSRQNVEATPWWKKNRKGARRKSTKKYLEYLQQQGQTYEMPADDD